MRTKMYVWSGRPATQKLRFFSKKPSQSSLYVLGELQTIFDTKSLILIKPGPSQKDDVNVREKLISPWVHLRTIPLEGRLRKRRNAQLGTRFWPTIPPNFGQRDGH